jgi:hypothetical protein
MREDPRPSRHEQLEKAPEFEGPAGCRSVPIGIPLRRRFSPLFQSIEANCRRGTTSVPIHIASQTQKRVRQSVTVSKADTIVVLAVQQLRPREFVAPWFSCRRARSDGKGGAYRSEEISQRPKARVQSAMIPSPDRLTCRRWCTKAPVSGDQGDIRSSASFTFSTFGPSTEAPFRKWRWIDVSFLAAWGVVTLTRRCVVAAGSTPRALS